jgi:hypothetical protein
MVSALSYQRFSDQLSKFGAGPSPKLLSPLDPPPAKQ